MHDGGAPFPSWMKNAALLIALISGGVLAAVLLTRETIEPGPPPVFLSRYEAAVEASKAQGRPLVLIFSARWCPQCITMKRRVYPTAAVAAVKDHFVWADLDVDESSSRVAVANLKVGALPAIFLLGPKEQILARTDGNHSAASFAAWLRENGRSH